MPEPGTAVQGGTVLFDRVRMCVLVRVCGRERESLFSYFLSQKVLKCAIDHDPVGVLTNSHLANLTYMHTTTHTVEGCITKLCCKGRSTTLFYTLYRISSWECSLFL